MELQYNQSDFDYRRAPGINQSSLKKILDSPAHYQAAVATKLIPTPAMKMGTALHCLSLDGKKAFDGAYFDRKKEGKDLTVLEMKEALDKKGITYKASAKKPELEALLYPEGKPVDRRTGLSEDEYAAVLGMANSLEYLAYFDPSQPDYIKHNEVSIYWDWMGVPCKARLDRVAIEQGLVLDLKTTDSVEPELFLKKVVGLGYDFQAGYYAEAARVAFGKDFKFLFAAVERRAPYSVEIYEASEEMMEEAKFKCEKALTIYAECARLDRWPNREPVIRQLDYPSWYNSVKDATENEPTEEPLF